MEKIKKFKSYSKQNRVTGLIVIAFIAIAGSTYLLFARAATTASTLPLTSSAVISSKSPTLVSANPAILQTTGLGNSIGGYRSFLKFNVATPNTTDTINSVQLKVYTQTANGAGFYLKAVADSTWDPTKVTYNTHPVIGNILANSGATTVNAWKTIDLTAIVKTTGLVSFCLYPKDSGIIQYSNAGTTAPQLVVTYAAASAPAPADTTAPTNVGITAPSAGSTVNGVYNFTSSASDNVGVAKVEFYNDSALIGTALTSTASGYVIPGATAGTTGYDTTKIADGTHNIYSIAYDAAGNKTQSTSVSYTVKNTTTSVPPSTSTTVRATFYYPWFTETWGSLTTPDTNYHPTAGFYSSDTASVITKHIQQMTYAGLDASIASWWGQGQHSESTRIPALLNNSANSSNGKNLKWSLYYEKESIGDPTVTEINADLTYIKSNYASNANYLQIGGKPVIFVFTDGNDACAMAQRWHDANTLGFYVVLKVFSGYTACATQPDGWHQYGPASAKDSQGKYSYTISPGFFKYNETTARLPRLSATDWTTNVNAMVASNAQFQLVTTFNEWGEGSAVEPATEWASTSGYGTYIDVLHQILNNTTATVDNAPSVTITSPANSATVNGIVQIKFLATDTDTTPVDNTSAKVTIDGTTQTATATGNANEFAYSWDTSTLADSSTHTITATASDTAGKSATSSAITVTKTATTCSGNPTTPSNVTTSLSGTTVIVGWGASTAAANCTIGSYQVWRAIGTNPASLLQTTTASTLSYNDATAPYSSSVKYYIIALDTASHQSTASAVSTITTSACSDSTAPTTPGSFTANSSTTSVGLSWTASTDSSACSLAGYKVYQTNGTTDTEIGTVPANASLNYNVTGLTASTAYTFKVKAYDSSSTANFSAAATVSTNTTAPSSDVTMVVAGDISKPNSTTYAAQTASLIKNQIKPSVVLTLGDNQYEKGILADFNTYFDKTWGPTSLGLNVYPSPGNHDYGNSDGAAGYYSYFKAGTDTINGNAVTGPANSGYYAFNTANNWRIYSMNTEANVTNAGTFLTNDMAANPRTCSIIFGHKPYYDYGTTHAGNGDSTLPWLKTFYANNGDVVLDGHEHNYQRFNPVNPNNDTVDTAKGLQSFVVGTGGADNLYTPFGATNHNANTLVATYNATWGVLKLTLHTNSYDWEFIPIATGGYTDSGSGQCH